MAKYVCDACGWEYDEDLGSPDNGIAPGTAFGKVLAQHILGEIGEAEMPLPLTEPKAQALRAVKEAYYEAGAQIAHFAGERF